MRTPTSRRWRRSATNSASASPTGTSTACCAATTRRSNLHVYNPGCEELDRTVRLRDWLRTHEDDRDLYARTKRELAQKKWKYVQNYADAKSEVIQDILGRACA